MKKILTILLAIFLLPCLAACADSGGDNENNDNNVETGSSTESGNNSETENDSETEENNQTTRGNNVLITYFSCTNTTEKIAELIAEQTGGTLYEIIAADPYTEEDLQYYTGGRCDTEQADESCRPEISGSVENMDNYDIIFLGYPIWHSQAPRIISTFLESYDFTGKTIIPFCTSHSSGIGSSATNLHSLASGADWQSGKRFSGSESADDIKDWIEGLNSVRRQRAYLGGFK